MIFLSAQPDDHYFLWQLQLQLYNFKLHDIDLKKVHILVGYDPMKGLQQDFLNFIEDNTDVNVHAYPDTRIKKTYLSSIRPHIIAKHLAAFPELQYDSIFYHDSDICFKKLPDFTLLNKGGIWYASDTRSYLDCSYITKKAGALVLTEMCRIVGVAVQDVEKNDKHAGGAQYLLKRTDAEFWLKVQSDCDRMYDYLIQYNNGLGFCNQGRLNQIQAWCTDMWVIWWNAIFYNREFQIHPELDFAWADSPIEQLERCKILHYTGTIGKDDPKLFRKTDYINYSPFHADLSGLDPEICGRYVRDMIDGYMASQETKKIDLHDVSFLIPVRIDSDDRLENVYAVTRYLAINLKSNIILTEIDQTSKIDVTKLPPQVKYFFIEDDSPQLYHTKYNNLMILNADTPYIALYDADIILPVAQIIEAVRILRENEFSAVFPYDGNFVNVDSLLKAMFIKLLDTNLFEENQQKLNFIARRSYGGCIFLNKLDYQEAGIDNELIDSWGPEDIERVKRLTILGYRVKRISGNLYHLSHSRGINSRYQSMEVRCTLMEEYLKICSFTKEELRIYVGTWSWGNPKVKLSK
ncbi:galactosyltransferase-related protein [Mucilaginibacter rubeus]|uniref:Galactosyltransferase C-terminal domain-containing protein n=1 Tax=Mucilaginibacter rubeus TaxID=2027860 RepID=A0A5C1HZS8_9SPHI|nr:galactosyltransferase-related protein [Mucilaginibacter rubeus]QEM11387.1 hypothetical protein DEO27_015585 [Mucilaginibacter rubeus]